MASISAIISFSRGSLILSARAEAISLATSTSPPLRDPTKDGVASWMRGAGQPWRAPSWRPAHSQHCRMQPECDTPLLHRSLRCSGSAAAVVSRTAGKHILVLTLLIYCRRAWLLSDDSEPSAARVEQLQAAFRQLSVNGVMRCSPSLQGYGSQSDPDVLVETVEGMSCSEIFQKLLIQSASGACWL